MGALAGTNTLFLMLCTAMVCLMTPGLAFFYGGLARGRSTLYIMMMSFIAMGVVSLIWIFGGYGLAFGQDMGGIVGNVTDFFGFFGKATMPAGLKEAGIPLAIFVLYQMMFCVITVPLMSGAFAERLRMTGFIILLVVFTILVYAPVCHWVWGGGWLQKLGFVDFAGGAVIHTTAGFGALASVIVLGRRELKKPGMQPSNLMAAAIGTGLLWFGWFGFNAGSALNPDGAGTAAFANSAIGLASGMVVYCIVARIMNGHVSFVDVLTGSVAGLATITPCAGYINPATAVIVGTVAGIVCNLFLALTAKRGWDDALGVWGVHGMGGFTGTLLIGILADASVNGVAASPHQFLIQLLGVVVIAVWSFLVCFCTFKILKDVCHLEPSQEQIAEGLDKVLLKEAAYTPGSGAAMAEKDEEE